MHRLLNKTPLGNKKNSGYFLRSSLFSSVAVALFIVRGGLTVGAPAAVPNVASEMFPSKIDPLVAISTAGTGMSSSVSVTIAGDGAVLGASVQSETDEEYSLSRSPRDQRAIRLEKYLHQHNAEFANYADLIVSESDKYGVDYKLVVAIAYHESGLGRVCWAPYNAWGYMTKDRWDSWDEGITKYIKGLYNGYYVHGADTVEEIAPRYVMTDAWPEFVVDIKKLMSDIP